MAARSVETVELGAFEVNAWYMQHDPAPQLASVVHAFTVGKTMLGTVDVGDI